MYHTKGHICGTLVYSITSSTTWHLVWHTYE